MGGGREEDETGMGAIFISCVSELNPMDGALDEVVSSAFSRYSKDVNVRIVR